MELSKQRRCRQFSVIQESVFEIPNLHYDLVIGDMSGHKVTSLAARLRSEGTIIKEFQNLKANDLQTISYEGMKFSIKFLTVEVKDLIPGVKEDSGLLEICADAWEDDTK